MSDYFYWYLLATLIAALSQIVDAIARFESGGKLEITRPYLYYVTLYWAWLGWSLTIIADAEPPFPLWLPVLVAVQVAVGVVMPYKGKAEYGAATKARQRAQREGIKALKQALRAGELSKPDFKAQVTAIKRAPLPILHLPRWVSIYALLWGVFFAGASAFYLIGWVD